MPSPSTKSGTRKLSEVARHLVVPANITSSGWPQVEKRCTEMGIAFDEWQRGAGRLLLAKTKDGKYAATVGGVGLSLPRQVGKTYLIGAIVFALCVDNPGLTVIWTAHHSRTAGETFLAMQGMARRKKIAPYVGKVYTAANSEEVRFVNRSRILFGARERGFGRGFAGVDILVCDEAQILTDRALDNMLATMNTAPNALPLFMGTPPTPADPSESFERMRLDALSGEATDVAWIECGASAGSDPDSQKTWAQANPSFPHRTPVNSMLRLRKKLKAESWLREGLGIWDDDVPTTIFGAGRWQACPTEEAPSPAAVGIAVSVDRSWSSLCFGAVVEQDEADETDAPSDVHVAPVARRAGVDWLVSELQSLQEQHPEIVFLADKGGPAKNLRDTFEDNDIGVEWIELDVYADACSDIFDKVQQGKLHRSASTELDDAVSGAAWRTVGDRQVWGRRQTAKSGKDVSMLEAATFAALGAEKYGSTFTL